MPILLRITTVPISLHLLLRGQFQFMCEHGFEVVTMSQDGKEVNEIVKEGTKHIVIPFTRKITPLQDLKCLWLLAREIRKLRPDIIHTHTPKAGLLGMLAAWICRVPIRLHTVAGLPLMETSGFKRKILLYTERITYACAHRVYPNSQGLLAFITQNLQVSNKKLKILGKGSSNGIDIAFFHRSIEVEKKARELRNQYSITESDFVFSFVGRIVGDKGIVELVKAFREISKEMTNCKLKLLLVGDFEKDLDPLPQDVLEFLHTNSQIILAGFQSDIRPWIVASDVFVFPSYREGFPNVVMQAGLLKVPCIVSDINGCNEIVKHNSTGIVIPTKNVPALVNAMGVMMQDSVRRQRFAENAQVFVSANFNREFIWEALRQEYELWLQLKSRG